MAKNQGFYSPPLCFTRMAQSITSPVSVISTAMSWLKVNAAPKT